MCCWSESLSLVHPSTLQSLSLSLSLSLSTHTYTHTAEFYEPKVPNLEFEYWCYQGTKEFCKDPAFMQGKKGGGDVYYAQTCSSEQELMTPACDLARLNQEGKEVDCWTDPKGEEEVKFHVTAGHSGAWWAIGLWVVFTLLIC